MANRKNRKIKRYKFKYLSKAELLKWYDEVLKHLNELREDDFKWYINNFSEKELNNNCSLNNNIDMDHK